MNANDEIAKHKLCASLIDEGKYKEALDLAETILMPSLRAAIYIDAGTASGKSGIVRQGTGIYEELLSQSLDIPQREKCTILYNAANGHNSIYDLKRRRRQKTIPTNNTNLRTAKRYYFEALALLENKTGPFASQLFVNIGNCLSQFGRYVESADYYQKALVADPTNGMAMGNLAIELEYIARILGDYRHEYIALAYDLLRQTFDIGAHLHYGSMLAQQSFKSMFEQLKTIIDAHDEPLLPPKPIAFQDDSPFEGRYLRFCIENGLLLNTWIGNQRLTPRTSDDIAFGPIIVTTSNEDTVLEVLKVLNEIKESYATARYIYFLPESQDDLLDSVSETTIYHGMDLYEVKGIYTGLYKTAYSRAFDILDKVARIINIYFGVGKREFSFWNLFVEKQSLGQEKQIRFAARQEIVMLNNPSIFALADLCIDYYENEHADYKTIDSRRNRITHDFLQVYLYEAANLNTANCVSLSELRKEIRSILHLTKSAILYAVSAVNIAEYNRTQRDDSVLTQKLISEPGQGFIHT